MVSTPLEDRWAVFDTDGIQEQVCTMRLDGDDQGSVFGFTCNAVTAITSLHGTL